MEDAWATPLPSRSAASSKRGRSGSPSPRSAGSDACGSPTPPSPALVCIIRAAGGLCGWAV
eukprot:4561359-Prymnesium_polylepis.1